jgi:hypothetical protein
MWEPQPFTSLWASTACYRDSFTLFLYIMLYQQHCDCTSCVVVLVHLCLNQLQSIEGSSNSGIFNCSRHCYLLLPFTILILLLFILLIGMPVNMLQIWMCECIWQEWGRFYLQISLLQRCGHYGAHACGVCWPFWNAWTPFADNRTTFTHRPVCSQCSRKSRSPPHVKCSL